MKQFIQNAVVVALLLCASSYKEQVQGHKLVQRSLHKANSHSHSHHKKRGMNSEDVDADDQDISEGPVKNDNDVAIYQDTFMSNGQNVHSLNQQVEHDLAQQQACDGQACTTVLDDNLTPNMSKAYDALEKQQQQAPPKKSEVPEPTGQQKRQIYAQEHPFRIADSSKQIKEAQVDAADDKTAVANTNKWARSRDAEIGEIETAQIQTGVSSGNQYLSVTDANDMLHAVVKSSQQEEYDQAHPALLQKSDEDLHKELIQQATEVDTQIDDLEHMSFSSKDLNSYTAMTGNNAGTNHPEPEAPKPAPPPPEKPKNFYEQLYDSRK